MILQRLSQEDWNRRNHGVDPQAYLQAIIERLPGTRTEELDTLLPATRAAHPAIKSESSKAA